ncbi:hypothetical protein [Tautonia marina]|uniref:hypothetical protein n=1 Tax=Tautonia marina TaxID=2653855 RepID=UPI0013762EA8|nr:hypothetical protein [Tautonia marina]
MTRRMRQRATRALMVIGALGMVPWWTGCGESEPAREYTVPEGATAEEISPGEPITPPTYRESSGLPGPPPGPPPVQ